MFEKVNPKHPDKIADRIAGAIVDVAYSKQEDPKMAVEVLIGHSNCTIIAETSVHIEKETIDAIVDRISGEKCAVNYLEVPQDSHLANNQADKIRCGDNGIFKGVPVTAEQKKLACIARRLYEEFDGDGKYIYDLADDDIIICQSNASNGEINASVQGEAATIKINPLGEWSGGINVDTGATNRKLGSDMGDAVTGGGLHGKDLSKADVSVNIYAHLKAQMMHKPVELYCAIGDETIDGLPYDKVVETARKYIQALGGFEKFAEWGLIR